MQSVDTSAEKSIRDYHLQLDSAHFEILAELQDAYELPSLAAAVRMLIWQAKAKIAQKRKELVEENQVELVEENQVELVEENQVELVKENQVELVEENQVQELITQLDELEHEAEELAFSDEDPDSINARSNSLIARLLPLLTLVCAELPITPQEFVWDFLTRYHPRIVPSFLVEEFYRWLGDSPQRE